MKKFLLLAMVVPSIALGIPIHLNGPESDFGAFVRAGYRVEHSQAFDPATGFTHWWVSFFREPGVSFDAHSISGALPEGLSEILVQRETPDGDYHSQIFSFKPAFTDLGETTVNLDEQFQNLSWLRIAGFGLDNDFVLNDVSLTDIAPASTENVPETGPGFFLLVLVLAGLAIVETRLRTAKPALCPARRRSQPSRPAQRRW